MEKSIVEKLRAFLAQPVDSECKVVYLLCEVRKLLERSDNRPPALWLYCCWALHVELKKKPTLELLNKIDTLLENHRKRDLDQEELRMQHELFRELLFFDSFREQLRELLRFYDVPQTICDDENWRTFLRHYVRVIEEVPLSCQVQPNTLKHVARAIIRVGSSLSTNPNPYPSFRIEVTGPKGSRVSIGVKLSEGSLGSVMSFNFIGD